MHLYLLFGLFVISQTALLTIKNYAYETIWIGITSSSVQKLNISGFALTAYDKKILSVADNWKGKVWPRTGCDKKTFTCETGDCDSKLFCQGMNVTPPYTLVDVEYKQGKGIFNISVLHGYNMAVVVIKDEPKCMEQCYMDIERNCPKAWKYKTPNGAVEGCKSNCDLFKIDQYCCKGNYGTPDKCDPDKWTMNLPEVFRTGCRTAITYPFDQPTRKCQHTNSSTIIFSNSLYGF